MRVKTSRFGEVEVPDREVLSFPRGLPGFAGLRRYVLIKTTDLGLFKWLQSADVPELAFVVCDPRLIEPDYRVAIHHEELADIELADVQAAEMLVILSYPQEVEKMTANLQGPIVINRARRLAKQVVLADESYSCCHKVFQERPKESAGKVPDQSVA